MNDNLLTLLVKEKGTLKEYHVKIALEFPLYREVDGLQTFKGITDRCLFVCVLRPFNSEVI